MTETEKLVKKNLSAADILETNDAQMQEVDVPEWGGVVRLRSLSAEEAMAFVDSFQKNARESAIRLVALSAVDDEGQLLFSDADVAKLKKKSLRAIMRVQTAAMELNGLADGAKTKEAAKND